MDMSMSMSMSSTASASMASSTSSSMDMNDMMMMVPYLHFTGGDNLFFKTLTPSSHGAIAGACIVLVALCICERWFASVRSRLTAHWRQRALAIATNKDNNCETSGVSTPTCDVEEVNINNLSVKYAGPVFVNRCASRTIEPFILSHDLPRGVLYAFQAFLAYTLMLAVMTFQAAYIIAIIVGLGLGEVSFGRLGNGDSHLLH
ncbi:Ctr copper transporter family-domain-containing protein [Rhodofomes roseus]|uniref:Copper transport protein n=1 Tax=Rhodofomes roseus TaxID=34475 RepID=A0ABQ8KDN7_9APHY|nr:Ctr copper transporter family-domain-containing protein [Rhodofomes roseus]KAH9835759.1 Ctr copper transporter family-domain-containing protein [Rhodofomes roseus]